MGLGSGQLDAGRKNMPLPVLPLKSLVETELRLSVTVFPPCYVKFFFHPLVMSFADSKLSNYFKLLKHNPIQFKTSAFKNSLPPSPTQATVALANQSGERSIWFLVFLL